MDLVADVDGLVARLRSAGCVFAEEEASILLEAASSPDELERLVESRVSGTPLEVLVGWAEFDGLRVAVAPGVFVPRRRTELLARRAAAAATTAALDRTGAVVVDLCCGTGAVGAAVLVRVPDVDLHAADLDPDAVACARRNLPPERVHEGDLFDALPAGLRGRVDVLACNAPYVPTAEIAWMPSEARDHEHRVALDGGVDGLDVHRRVIAEAPRWLTAGGVLLVESSRAQAPVTAGLMSRAGLDAEVVHDDDTGATVVVGHRR